MAKEVGTVDENSAFNTSSSLGISLASHNPSCNSCLQWRLRAKLGRISHHLEEREKGTKKLQYESG